MSDKDKQEQELFNRFDDGEITIEDFKTQYAALNKPAPTEKSSAPTEKITNREAAVPSPQNDAAAFEAYYQERKQKDTVKRNQSLLKDVLIEKGLIAENAEVGPDTIDENPQLSLLKMRMTKMFEKNETDNIAKFYGTEKDFKDLAVGYINDINTKLNINPEQPEKEAPFGSEAAVITPAVSSPTANSIEQPGAMSSDGLTGRGDLMPGEIAFEKVIAGEDVTDAELNSIATDLIFDESQEILDYDQGFGTSLISPPDGARA